MADEIGWRLACTGHYQSTPYRATPALPCLLALVYRVAGHSYPTARAIQAVSGGMLVLCIYSIGASLFGKAVGRLAAIGVALYPPLVYMSGVLYAEHLYTVLLAATVVCLINWSLSQRFHWAALSGLTLGICALVLAGFHRIGALGNCLCRMVRQTQVARRSHHGNCVDRGCWTMDATQCHCLSSICPGIDWLWYPFVAGQQPRVAR